MSISLNNVNSEVVRAHKRLDNCSVFPGSLTNNLYNSQRKSNTNYTNGDYFKMVYFCGNNYPANGGYIIHINNIRMIQFQGYGSYYNGGFFIVPPKATYKIHANNVTLEGWYETTL